MPNRIGHFFNRMTGRAASLGVSADKAIVNLAALGTDSSIADKAFDVQFALTLLS